MDDYNGEELEVVRQIGNGLFMIQIDFVFQKDFVLGAYKQSLNFSLLVHILGFMPPHAYVSWAC